MQKIWQLLPEIDEKSKKNYKELGEIIAQLLFNRNLLKKKEIEEFFSKDYEGLIHDPFSFLRMDEATELIISNIKKQNLIYIYGDYDADGVTASSLLYDALSLLGAKVKVYLPDRVTEGYGMNKAAIDYIRNEGAKLIITVDCGIRDKDNAIYANMLGMELIITDHHMPPEDKAKFPQCIVIDALSKKEKYPFKFLAGVGISYKLSCALIEKSKWPEDKKKKIKDSLLDLVAIGTVADTVPLLGENRILVKKGLVVLNKTRRKGLIELIKVSKLDENKNLDSWNIGFQLGPRINAAGRMDHANTAFKLLVTADREEAAKIAVSLNLKNIDRQKLTDDIFAQVDKQAQKQINEKIIIGLCQIDENELDDVWNEGVIGLVAGKICEKYYLPVLVVTITENCYKGSGRSVPELDLINLIEQTKEYLDKFGGHPAACGFSLKKENFTDFAKKIRELAEAKLGSTELIPKIVIEGKLDFKEINLDLVKKIDEFAPFGKDNDKPKFVTYGVKVFDKINMGAAGQHLKLKLKSADSGVLNAIGFGQTERWNELRIGDTIDIVYYLDINEFNGYSNVQLKIIDIKINK